MEIVTILERIPKHVGKIKWDQSVATTINNLQSDWIPKIHCSNNILFDIWAVNIKMI